MPGIARVLATLPTDHTPFKGFGWRRPTADPSVGLLVLFSPPNSPPWVGNFATHGDIGQLPVASHPDGQHVVVVLGGPAYVVDPVTREISATFGDHFLDALATDYPPLLVFNQGGLWFEAHDIDGLRWRTRRVSWDEIRNMRQVGDHLEAETSESGQRWIPVAVDLDTGVATGGAYPIHLP